VTNMTNMFFICENLKLIQVSDKWVVGESTTTTNMFSRCGTNTVTLKSN